MKERMDAARVAKLAKWLQAGNTRDVGEKNLINDGYTSDEACTIMDSVEEIVKHEKRKARAAGLAKLRKQLKESDKDIASEAIIKRVSTYLRELMTTEELDGFNSDLKEKSGKISFEDIAFMACVHRNSILTNGRGEHGNPNYINTSPFNRIQSAAVKFKYREREFDDRQIRYGLNILQVLGFTNEYEKGIKGRTSGKWSLSNDPEWTTLF